MIATILLDFLSFHFPGSENEYHDNSYRNIYVGKIKYSCPYVIITYVHKIDHMTVECDPVDNISNTSGKNKSKRQKTPKA